RRPARVASPRWDRRRYASAGEGRRLGPGRNPRREPFDPVYGLRRHYPPNARSVIRDGREDFGMTAQRLPRPQPRPGVLDIEPYVPGKSAAEGVARVFKLSSNETPLGPSPKAKAAYAAVAEHLQDY